MSFICNFCNKNFSSTSSVNYHKETAKYCLKIQGKEQSDKQFKCVHCNKIFTSKNNLNYHLDSCKFRNKKETDNERDYLLKEIEKYKLLYKSTKIMLDKANNTVAISKLIDSTKKK